MQNIIDGLAYFTGKERDSESGNDYFGARYYSSNMGRFLTPDWSKNPQGVPYANYTYPQSLNLYVYVGNNPLSLADADGHCTDVTNGPCEKMLAAKKNSTAATSQSQQTNGSSSGRGFWSNLGQHLGNLAQLHSWNYGMRESVTVSILPAESDPGVTVAANALSVVGAATHNSRVGAVGALLSLANHPDPPEVGLIGMSLVPPLEEAGVALGLVYDGAKPVGNWITNNVMKPMLNALPGPTMGVTGDGQEVQAPDLSDPQTWGATN